jgi:hypothetical protein
MEAPQPRLGSASTSDSSQVVATACYLTAGGRDAIAAQPVVRGWEPQGRDIYPRFKPPHHPITAVMDLGPRAKQDTTQGGRACCSIALKIGSGAGIHAPFHGPQHLTYQLPSGRMLLENSKPQLSASLQCVLLHTHASGSSSRTASGCLNPALCHVQSSSSLANFALPCSGANSPFGDPKRASRAGRRASLPKRAAWAARDGISPSSIPPRPHRRSC